MNRAFDESRKKIAEVNAEIESSVSGVRITKAYNAEATETKKFDAVNARFKKARSDSYRAMGMFQGGMSAFNDFLYLIALVAGGLLFYKGVISGADFTAFILYVTMLLTPLAHPRHPVRADPGRHHRVPQILRPHGQAARIRAGTSRRVGSGRGHRVRRRHLRL